MRGGAAGWAWARGFRRSEPDSHYRHPWAELLEWRQYALCSPQTRTTPLPSKMLLGVLMLVAAELQGHRLQLLQSDELDAMRPRFAVSVGGEHAQALGHLASPAYLCLGDLGPETSRQCLDALDAGAAITLTAAGASHTVSATRVPQRRAQLSFTGGPAVLLDDFPAEMRVVQLLCDTDAGQALLLMQGAQRDGGRLQLRFGCEFLVQAASSNDIFGEPDAEWRRDLDAKLAGACLGLRADRVRMCNLLVLEETESGARQDFAVYGMRP
ncbi:hypothetical protein SS50377_27956 [Spironucleus salmonicida]|uniref:Uncharacterized protein n=1 Tax=Spironucleus salmonicida TaxID=348837 RepID=A0A9P8LKF3_9EUKA|nr:hypothetical protein SS50377_27956 [Spironucleus salmonicida]